MSHERDALADVNKDAVKRILEDAGLRPITLTKNDNNSFTASFDKLPSPIVQDDVIKAHPNIVIVKPDNEDKPVVSKPNVEPNLPALIHFGFTKPID